jgi:hypothetical protein
MNDFSRRVQAFNQLALASKTVEAMETFYADDVEMQENEDEPRKGKAFCLEYEKQNLTKTKAVEFKLLHQVIDEKQELVFSEWQIDFTNNDDKRFLLKEAIAQHWKNGLVHREKFYYKGFQEKK